MATLKIIHINTYDGNGGAGKACLRLNEALNRQPNISSQVLVLYAFGQEKNVLNYAATWLKKIRAVVNIFAERWLPKRYVKLKNIPFSLQKFGVPVWKHPAVKAADIIHLHWINHGFLNPKQLQKLQQLGKPIVWTFHDSNAFTGGCHVRYDCVNFTRHCGNCPILEESNAEDISRQTANAKQMAYENLDFTIIAPSKWMQQSVQMSSLLGTRKVFRIPNTLDEQVFKPYVKKEAKKALQIAEQQFVILSGFMPSKKDAHKGADYLIDALQHFANYRDIDRNRIELLVFGTANADELSEIPFKVRALGTLKTEQQMAACYAAADVFITASIEDNLPNTVMESLSCATPVLAFTTGGIPDMVQHQHSGYLAKYKDVNDLAQGLHWIYTHPQPLTLQKNARNTVLEKFAFAPIAETHVDVYDLILAQKNDAQ